MIEWWGWEYLLEVGNGELAIMTGWLSVFLVYHVVKVGSQRGAWSLRAWRKLPQSMQLAISFLAVTLAAFITAVVIWSSRYTNGILVVRGIDSIVISVARILSVIGFLCALRVVTRPMRGQWPWLGAIGCGLAYLAWSVARLF